MDQYIHRGDRKNDAKMMIVRKFDTCYNDSNPNNGMDHTMIEPYMIIGWISLLSILSIGSTIVDLFTGTTEEHTVIIDPIDQIENENSSLSSLEDSYDFDDVSILED